MSKTSQGQAKSEPLYATSTLSGVKADRLAAQNDQPVRVQAKQAILRELNRDLQIRAERVRLKDRLEEPYYRGRTALKHDGSLLERLVSATRDDSDQPAPDSSPGCGTVTLQSNMTVETVPQSIPGAQLSASQTPCQQLPVSRIPTSAARRRRRENGGRSHVNIQNYRPGYTWNRGGRIKELKIRCIARKFLFCWIKNTFGRVLPSRASEHHRRLVLRDIFYEWKDLWWVARKEWRLGVRAELHNRYRMWNITWQAWREFTVEHRVKTAKKRLAQKQADMKLLLWTMQAWNQYMVSRRAKKVLYKTAEDTHCHNLCRSAWTLWVRRCEETRLREQQQSLALQHWAHTLIYSTWERWRGCYEDRQRKKERMWAAQQYHNLHVLVDCVARWRQYVAVRRAKERNYAFAAKMHRGNLMDNVFQQWKRRWRVLCSISEHHQQSLTLASHARCRRVFVHWCHYVDLRRQKKDNQNMADSFYRGLLLRRVFFGMGCYLRQQKLQHMRLVTAARFSERRVLAAVWHTWSYKYDSRCELHQLPGTKRAQHHYRKTCLRKMLSTWRQYIEWRRQRKVQYVIADNHYRKMVLPLCIEAMRQFVELRRRKREMREEAENFRQLNLQACFLYRWHAAYEQSQDVRLMHRMAILNHEKLLQQEYFLVWRARYHITLDDAVKWGLAVEHYEFHLRNNFFSRWWGHTLMARQRYSNECKAATHCYLCQVRLAWKGWTQYVVVRREKARKKALATGHYQGKLLRRTYDGWTRYQGRWREIFEFVEGKRRYKNMVLLRHVLGTWCHKVQLQIAWCEKETVAKQHCDIHLLLKVFASWQSFAAIHAQKKLDTSRRVEDMQKQLEQGVMRRTFVRWQQRRDEALIMRLKYVRAVSHDRHVTLSHAFKAWSGYMRLMLRKQLMKRQAALFLSAHLTAMAFRHWQCVRSLTVAEHSNTVTALWHWSLTLQTKVLIAWFAYTEERKRKAKRVAEALERRRVHLLRRGVQQLLLVAADMTLLRQKMAAQQGAQNFFKIQTLVQKCAARWRNVTIRRRVEKSIHTTHTAVPPCVGRKAKMSATLAPSQRELPQQPQVCLSPVARSKVMQSDGANTARRMPDLCVVQPGRPAPRHPSFLVESLKREGLYAHSPEKPFKVDTGLASDDLGRLPLAEPRDFSLDEGSQLSHDSHATQACDRPTSSPAFDKQIPACGRMTSSGFVHFETSTDELSDTPRSRVERGNVENTDNVVLGTDAPTTNEERENDVPSGAALVFPVAPTAAGRITLLPPTAFLVKSDGTPIVSINGNSENLTSFSNSHIVSPPKLRNENRERLPQPLLLRPTVGITKTGAGGDSLDGAASLDQMRSRCQFSSAADELVYIRRELQWCAQNMDKLRDLELQKLQLAAWLTDQAPNSDDPYDTEVRTELTQLEKEVDGLLETTSAERPWRRQLALRAQTLLEELTAEDT